MSLALFGTPQRKSRAQTPSRTPMRGIRLPSQTPPPLDTSSLQPLASFHAVQSHFSACASDSISGDRRYGKSRDTWQQWDFPYDELNVEDDLDEESVDGLDSDVRHSPGCSSSVAYLPEAATLARIVHDGKTLELRYVGPALAKRQRTPGQELVRINFSAPIHDISTSNCFYFDPSTKQFTITVIDKKSRIYQLTFEDPKYQLETGLPAYARRLKNMHVGWLSMSEPDMISSGLTLQGKDLILWHVMDRQSLIIAAKDGLIKCTMHDDGKCDPLDSHSPPFSHPSTKTDWTHEYFKRPSSFRMFRSSTDEQTRVISLAVRADTRQVYGVTMDKKLRIWDCETLIHDLAIDLGQTNVGTAPRAGDVSIPTPSQLGTTNAPLVQVIDGTTDTPYDRYVITFTPTPRSPEGGGYFQVFGVLNVTRDLSHVGFFTCSIETVGTEFRGFNVERVALDKVRPAATTTDASSTWRLWTAWDIKGRPMIEWSDITALVDPLDQDMGHMSTNIWHGVPNMQELHELQPVFDSTYHDSLNQTIEEQEDFEFEDIDRAFIDDLLYPGRFSEGVLWHALREYNEDHHTLPSNWEQREHKSPRDVLSSSVGKQFYPSEDDYADPERLVELKMQLKLDWQRFWVSVQQGDLQARWPVRLVPMNDGQSQASGAMLVCREGIVAPTLEDDVLLARRVVKSVDLSDEQASETSDLGVPDYGPEAQAFLDAHPAALEAYHPILAPSSVRSSVMAVLRSASALSKTFEPSTFWAFQDTFNQKAASPMESSINDRIICAVQELDDDTTSSRQSLLMQMIKGNNIRHAIDETLELLLRLSPSWDSEHVSSFDTRTGLGLRVSGLSQIIAVRALVSSEVLLLAAYLHQNPTIADGISDDAFTKTVSKAFTVYYQWETLRQLSTREAYEGQSGNTFDTPDGPCNEKMTPAFIEIRRDWRDRQLFAEDSTVGYSLLHTILAGRPGSSGMELTTTSVAKAAYGTIRQLDLVTQRSQVVAGPGETRMAMDLLLSGNTTMAIELLDMFPPCAGAIFVRALYSLMQSEDTDVTQVTELFEMVSAAIGE